MLLHPQKKDSNICILICRLNQCSESVCLHICAWAKNSINIINAQKNAKLLGLK